MNINTLAGETGIERQRGRGSQKGICGEQRGGRREEGGENDANNSMEGKMEATNDVQTV